jgi:hypothetical protein
MRNEVAELLDDECRDSGTQSRMSPQPHDFAPLRLTTGCVLRYL